MKFILILIFLTIALQVPEVRAQCGAGVNTGGQCVPPEVLYGQNNPERPRQEQPSAVWKTQWGAIVVDSNTGQAGTVVGYKSKSDAIDAAMHDCKLHGSPKCELKLAYHNQCAAIAWGSSAYFTGGGPTKENAESFSMKGCGKGTTNCKIEYSGCSLPVRVR